MWANTRELRTHTVRKSLSDKADAWSEKAENVIYTWKWPWPEMCTVTIFTAVFTVVFIEVSCHMWDKQDVCEHYTLLYRLWAFLTGVFWRVTSGHTDVMLIMTVFMWVCQWAYTVMEPDIVTPTLNVVIYNDFNYTCLRSQRAHCEKDLYLLVCMDYVNYLQVTQFRDLVFSEIETGKKFISI